MNFREFLNNQIISERIFTTVKNYGDDVAVYLNPSIGDIAALFNSSYQVRGLTKGDYVFVWDSNFAMHKSISDKLEAYDEELKNMPTNICFYLNKKSISPLQCELAYSQWTGQSIKGKAANIHLRKLLTYPCMQKMASIIVNLDDINNSDGFSLGNSNDDHDDWGHDHDDWGHDHHPTNPTNPTKPVPTSIATWQKNTIKPYQWKNGLHRLGD